VRKIKVGLGGLCKKRKIRTRTQLRDVVFLDN